MLQHHPDRYTPGEALRWLAWLARSMRDRSHSEFQLDRLTPDWLPTTPQRRFAALVPAIIGGLAFGLAFGLAGWLAGGLTDGLVGVPFGMLFGGLGLGLTDDDELAAGLAAAQGLPYELCVGLAGERTTPNEGIHRSARDALALGLGVGLVGGLGVGLACGFSDGLGFGLVVGLLFGLVCGGACLRHVAIRALLARNRSAPLRYVRFLEEARERLFLRRAGSGYTFVHRLLLEYFAGLDTARLPAATELPVAA